MENRSQADPQGSYKDFYMMVIGQVISILGSALLRFALSLYILDITGRADIYALLFAISNIPLLLSPLGGAVADRFSRQKLMVIFDFTSSAIIFLYYFLMAGDLPIIMLTGTVMVALSVISSMYSPAVTASIPLLVEERRLEAANGMVNGVQALSNVAAPIIGGVCYGIFGVNTLVLISGAAFFCSAVLELFIRIPFVKRGFSGPVIPAIAGDLKEGITYVVRKPMIRKAMILAALLNMILTPFFVVGGPIILKNAMHSTDAMYGIGMGSINFATILGALAMGLTVGRLHMKNLYRLLLFIAALFAPMALAVTPQLAGLGFYPGYLLFLGCSIPVAMIMTIVSIFVITRVQRETPNENLGKVMACIMAVSQCTAPLGQLAYGLVFQVFDSAIYLPALFICGAMVLLSLAARKMMENEVELC